MSNESTTTKEEIMTITAADWSRSNHGHDEINGLINGAAYHQEVDHTKTLTLKELELAGGKMSRMRFLGEVIPGRGYCVDVSYLHATLPDGTIVPVRNYLDNLIPRYRLKSYLIDWAKREGVYGKRIGLLNESVWSFL